MLEVKFNIPDLEKLVLSAVMQANDAGIRAAANYAIVPLKAAIPVKTGQMRDQTQIHYFRKRSGFLGASLKVIGQRHFVAHILEYGASSHGGRLSSGSRKKTKRTRAGSRGDRGPIPAKHTFAKVFQAIESQIIGTYEGAFVRSMESQKST